MKRVILTAGLCALASLPALAGGPRDTVVSTAAYAWVGDSIVQGEYKAYAVSEEEITGNYKARPRYFMPVEQTWRRKNDLSAYPRLKTPEKLLAAVYNMGLDEMVNAVEADTTLRTGKEWAGVWTRDVSYSIILSMAALQPEASMTSLKRKVNSRGVIVQDTGSGGAWPVSTDRMVWLLAAWEVYKVTGDRAWLEYAYGVGCRSMADDREVVYTPQGTVRGETSFIDWREQSYPRWMQTADIYASEASNTNIVHAAATGILGEMAEALGKKKEAAQWDAQSQGMAKLINEVFYMADKGYYGMYRYGRQNLLMNPREETLGAALAILYGIADAEQSKTITESVPVTPFGPAIFFPQIADMPNYHNNALWPFVAAYWTLANAKAGNGEGVMQGMGSIVRPAALFATNKENFNLDNGDIYSAKVVGTDSTTDLAVIKLDNPPKDLTPITFANSDSLTPGEPIMAIGNPLGYDGTVTTGIVSALNRPVTVMDEENNNAIVTNAVQIDAAINPGNSGGPTFNAAGQVIGINSSIASTASSTQTAGSIGIGFAIPANLVKRVADEIIQNGKVEHVALGVTIQSATVEADGVTRGGAVVKSVVANSPAAKAGVKTGDTIVGFNGLAVNNNYSLLGFVRAAAMGSTAKLTVVRDGHTMELNVTFDQAEAAVNGSNRNENQNNQNGQNDQNNNGQNDQNNNDGNSDNNNRNRNNDGLIDPFGMW